MECKGDPNKCACTYTACSRRGQCCACLNYHRAMGEIPGCLFTKEGERKWDRSLEAFLKDRGH